MCTASAITSRGPRACEIFLLVVDMFLGFCFTPVTRAGVGPLRVVKHGPRGVRTPRNRRLPGIGIPAQAGVYAETNPEGVLPVALSGRSAASVWLAPLCAPSNSARHAEVTSRGRPGVLRRSGPRGAHH